jgi:hypothetical protein
MLRILSAAANFIYIIYGFLLVAPPLIIGGTIVILIHAYHIYKLIQNNKVDYKNSEVYECEVCRQMNRITNTAL